MRPASEHCLVQVHRLACGGQSVSPSWIEADTGNLILVSMGPLLICSKQMLFFFHLEAKTLMWHQAGFKGKIHTQRPEPSQGVTGGGSPFPWHLHRTSSKWSICLSLSDPPWETELWLSLVFLSEKIKEAL